MKTKIVLILLIFLPLLSAAQVYDTIFLGTTTTVHLVMPDDIISYDIGSGVDAHGLSDFIISPNGTKMLKMAAAIENFKKTNLFIETSGGLYNYILKYTDFPQKLVVGVTSAEQLFPSASPSISPSKIPPVEEKQMSLSENSELIITKKIKAPYFKVRGQKAAYAFHQVFTDNNSIYFLLAIKNEGNIKYDTGYIGFISTVKRKGRTTVSQSEELFPVFVYNSDKTTLLANETVYYVYVFDKFTLDEGKILNIEFWENDGERKILIPLPANTILSAIKI